MALGVHGELEVAEAQERVARKVGQTLREKQRAEAKEVELADDRLVVLPGGRRALASEFLGHKYASINETEQEFLAHPERFLKDPDPNMAYLLPDGDAVTTQARIKGGRYTPVEMKEMDLSKCPPTHEGSDGFVHWYRHILVKVPKELAEGMYRLPEQEAIRRLTGSLTKFRSDVEKESKGMGRATISRKFEKE